MQTTIEELETALKECGRRFHWERERLTRSRSAIVKQNPISPLATVHKKSIHACVRVNNDKTIVATNSQGITTIWTLSQPYNTLTEQFGIQDKILSVTSFRKNSILTKHSKQVSKYTHRQTLTIFNLETKMKTHHFTTAPFHDIIAINDTFILLRMLSNQIQILKVEDNTITPVHSILTEPNASNVVITTEGEICYFRYGKIHVHNVTKGERVIIIPEPVYERNTMIHVGKDLVLINGQVWNLATEELVRKIKIDLNIWLNAEPFFLGSDLVVLTIDKYNIHSTKSNLVAMRVAMVDISTGEFLYECRSSEPCIASDYTARGRGIHWANEDKFLIANTNCIVVWQLPYNITVGEKSLKFAKEAIFCDVVVS